MILLCPLQLACSLGAWSEGWEEGKEERWALREFAPMPSLPLPSPPTPNLQSWRKKGVSVGLQILGPSDVGQNARVEDREPTLECRTGKEAAGKRAVLPQGLREFLQFHVK